MITKQNTIICDKCGLFCQPVDSCIPFGCQGDECLEPLDERHICKKCYPKFEKEWEECFMRGDRDGDWQKSNAEVKMAKKFGLVWVDANGVGILGTKYFLDSYRYYDKKVYQSLSKLPYWGWCLKCGSERKGGYCSDKKCEDSFDYYKKD